MNADRCLRSQSSGTSRGGPSRTTANKRQRDECPVCLEEIQGARTNLDRVTFPCGHSICCQCNQGMLRRDDHRCPTCREPRRGFTTEMANASAEARMHQDMAEEANQPSSPPSMVLYFSNQAQGNPFEVLQSVSAPGGVRVARSGPARNTRGRRMVASTLARIMHRAVNDQRQPRRAEQESIDEDDNVSQNVETNVVVQISGPRMPESLLRMISELTRPSSLSTFQEVRRSVR